MKRGTWNVAPFAVYGAKKHDAYWIAKARDPKQIPVLPEKLQSIAEITPGVPSSFAEIKERLNHHYLLCQVPNSKDFERFDLVDHNLLVELIMQSGRPHYAADLESFNTRWHAGKFKPSKLRFRLPRWARRIRLPRHNKLK